MKIFAGQTASQGFVHGPAFIIKPKNLKPLTTTALNIEADVKSFYQSIERAKLDITNFSAEAKKSNKVHNVEILEAHLTLLDDPEASDQTIARIRDGASADFAYHAVIEEFRNLFLQVKDEVIRQRAVDLHDIRERVLFYLQNPNLKFPDLFLAKPSVLVANDLTPSQILGVSRENLLGFATIEGSPTSHTSILARSLEIPAVVGLSEEIHIIENGQEIYIDGNSAKILVTPTPDERDNFLKRKSDYQNEVSKNLKFIGQPSMTSDGHKVTLAANISGSQDLISLKKNDAESVGLYRTEFLFLDRQSAPSETEQYEMYKAVFDGMGDKHVIVRTLDIGGDKQADYLNMAVEENPFLGVRALRLCFQRPAIFKTQLRALFRAGAQANWGLMFPMVSQLEELQQAKAIVAEVLNELTTEGLPHSKNQKIGIMIEIPSAAWMIDVFVKHVDFISIGTNDLLQYSCAADRLNKDLKSVYNPYNIGFLKQIFHVLDSCQQNNIHSGICGSLSHHPDLMAFFVGCGVSELSMTAQHVLGARSRLNELNLAACRQLVHRVLKLETTDQVKSEFSQFFSR